MSILSPPLAQQQPDPTAADTRSLVVAGAAGGVTRPATPAWARDGDAVTVETSS